YPAPTWRQARRPPASRREPLPLTGTIHMQIMHFRLHDGAVSARGFRVVARFAVEVIPGLTIQDWQLVETPEGNYLAYPPAGANRRATTLIRPEVRADIIRGAMEF